MDGRGRTEFIGNTNLAENSDAPRGSLFWAIPRVWEDQNPNLVLESASVKMDMLVRMPSEPSKPMKTSWREQDLPQIPLLVNTKEVKPRTKLLALTDLKMWKLLHPNKEGN